MDTRYIFLRHNPEKITEIIKQIVKNKASIIKFNYLNKKFTKQQQICEITIQHEYTNHLIKRLIIISTTITISQNVVLNSHTIQETCDIIKTTYDELNNPIQEQLLKNIALKYHKYQKSFLITYSYDRITIYNMNNTLNKGTPMFILMLNGTMLIRQNKESKYQSISYTDPKLLSIIKNSYHKLGIK